MGSIDRQIGIR